MEFEMDYFIVFLLFIDLTQKISQLKNLWAFGNQLYNYFQAYRFDKKICEILKSSKTKFGRYHHIGASENWAHSCNLVVTLCVAPSTLLSSKLTTH